jgi:dynein heavy chain
LRFLKEIPHSLVMADGEECYLKNCILRGEVEDWFRSIEESMKLSIKGVIRNGLMRFEAEDTKRTDWIQEHSSQVI